MFSFPTPGATKVVVINPFDNVEVSATSSDTTTVELVPRGTDGAEIVDEATVICSEWGDGQVITITLPIPRSFSKRRHGVDVRVAAPEGVDVTVQTNGAERSLLTITRGSGGQVRLTGTVGNVDVAVPSGDVAAENVAGSLSFKTASGDLSAARVDGPLKIRTVSGDVSIGELNGEASLTLVSGDVVIDTAHKSFDITSISGDVTLIDVHDGATCKTTSGDIDVRRAWAGSVRVATVSGDLTVGIPAGRGISVDAKSMSGDLHSEIDLDDSAPSSHSGPTVKISAHSVSGDVSIERSNAVSV